MNSCGILDMCYALDMLVSPTRYAFGSICCLSATIRKKFQRNFNRTYSLFTIIYYLEHCRGRRPQRLVYEILL